nr:hybrid signal transduction histidine kinase M [Tanacetum cinerariifolium]
MTINEYCTKIKSMADRLKNLGCAVREKNLVIYAINGLDSHFATPVEIIWHRESLTTFKTTRNMLLLKESSFNDESSATTMFESSSSSPTVFMASNSLSNKGNTDKPSNIPQICNHFNKGSCKFGDRCKYIHDHRNRSGLNPKNHGTVTSGHAFVSRLYDRPNSTWTPPTQAGYYHTFLAQQSNHNPLQPISQPGLASYGLVYQTQATYLGHQPTVAQQHTPQMDTVTKSSTSPTAFLSISASTWHQLLDYPGDEVLRSLISRHFISHNKENYTHICHTCQLCKHVKLPFHSSDSIVEHCFDIIHSDLWTSPIHKFHADGTLRRYKARLVANGRSQQC